jgi:hypothetical protein
VRDFLFYHNFFSDSPEKPKKYSRLVPLSLNHCSRISTMSIVCFALGNSMPEPLFKDFQEQVFEESEVFLSGQHDKCPRSTLHL